MANHIDEDSTNSQPTPPTPTGAGTETPRTDAAVTTHAFGESGRHKYVDPDFARQLERELTSLRRQAEADRATMEEQMQALGLCDDDRTVIADEIRRIRDEGRGYFHELTALRAQLATADKDRERMDWLEAKSKFIISLGGAHRGYHDLPSVAIDYWPSGGVTTGLGVTPCTLRAAIDAIIKREQDAALQPSASLDHGATDANQDKP